MRRWLHALLACALLAAGLGMRPAPPAPHICCGMDMGDGCPCPPPKAPRQACIAPLTDAALPGRETADKRPAPPTRIFPVPSGRTWVPTRRVTPVFAPETRQRLARLRCWRT